MQLPSEVYPLIVRNVGRRADLSALCLVSKRIQTVAERELYQTLDMAEPSVTIMLCEVLAKQPRLSQLVITLVLYPNEEANDDNVSPASDYWTSLSRALPKTTHLRSLRIYMNSGMPTNHAWVLGSCNFQLHTFHCDLAWDAYLASFLSAQRELADLYISDFNEDIPENVSIRTHSLRQARALPSLSILDCTFTKAVGVFVPGRPVTHVKTCFSSSSSEARRVELALLLADLRLSTRPIRSLIVADESYTTTFSLEFLSSLVRAFGPTPQLRYVGPLVLPVDGHEVSHTNCPFSGRCARLTVLFPATRVLRTPHTPTGTAKRRAGCFRVGAAAGVICSAARARARTPPVCPVTLYPGVCEGP
jgi:hypothetical protein